MQLTYLPILGLVLVTVALLYATTAKQHRRLPHFRASITRLTSKRRWLPVAFWGCISLFLLSYIWTYQRVQDTIAAELVTSGIEGVTVGSLIIPYSAFFRRAYRADTGFARSKKRARAEVSIQGNFWRGYTVHISEREMVKVNKLTGKKFVFSYLTDVKTLRAVIERRLAHLVRTQQIAAHQIETFDNRGPYIIVALHPQNRGQDITQAATAIAEDLFADLTVTNALKVNQVVVKVVEPEPYIANRTISVIGRGTAGQY